MVPLLLLLGWPGPGAPDTCASCHPTEVAEWRASRHAVAGTNAIFRASYEHFPHPWCLTCHAPEGDEPTGVSCASCHAPGRDPGAPETCATCHEFPFQAHTPAHPFHLSTSPSQETVTEWRSSTAAAAGRTCTDCHMATHGHRFPGAHTPALVRDLLTVEVRTAGDVAHVTVRAPGAAHRVPTGDPFRRIELRLCADRACETVVGFASLRRDIARTATSWAITADRTVPPETPAAAAVRELVVPLDAPARFWRLDYRYGDRRFEPQLAPEDVGYVVATGEISR